MLDMTEEEIIRRYKRMNPYENRLKILAELNGCSQTEIHMVVMNIQDEKKVKKIPKIKQKLNEEEAMRMYEEGASDIKIAYTFNCSRFYIGNWRRKHKLAANRYKTKFERSWK